LTDRPTFRELFSQCRKTAIHLEMRDSYTPDDPVFLAWQAGKPVDILEEWRDWYDLIREVTERGVTVRRARVVSEPVTSFIRHEYESTGKLNIPAGEHVRWLPRQKAKGILLPANDIWIFDDRVVRFGFFSGAGRYLGQEVVEDRRLAAQFTAAFESVWSLAVDHALYVPA
jgi:hypothetical protein